jgi:hypothetical protein
LATGQSQSNKPIIPTVKPDLSLTLGDGLVAALEAATAEIMMNVFSCARTKRCVTET